MARIYANATEYVSNQLKFDRGGPADVTGVGVFHSKDPDQIPDVSEFTSAALVQPGDALADGDRVDVLSLIGPKEGDITLEPGRYLRWVLVQTSSEDIIRRTDVLEVV